ncbi:hypothetical protein ASPVEDRAFT_72968 [Aspergillus versicolor CBS 583.65]|uniref:Uncharacterized protein n=1 Tax=Aspergillus versicolor CBS 583.65 TaxID=1036611 RepID=A0A1L9PPA5_ASPVE|nr:uncharacterized protein ASPVEDRAFT_72968 [Aspergillus versicolor CBS 583.65]OJJ03245.1 hypothetical protein ASPVEDRAFT_72968 [Aspergillus versicolor CBS 583.65]
MEAMVRDNIFQFNLAKTNSLYPNNAARFFLALMPCYRDTTITRDGFQSSYGRFFTDNGRVERVDGASLRRMFLPKITPEGNEQLRDCRNFVRDQLQHYGVSFDESQFSGNGMMLLKRCLEAGKCDTVPVHILSLQEQMHREWIETQDREYIADYVDWCISNWTDARSREKVSGLHQETARGCIIQTVFMGWDSAAVKKAASGHAAKGKKEFEAPKKKLKEEEDKLAAEKTEKHNEYLKSLKKKKTNPSPIGADELNLDIHATDEPGNFQACFDFGVIEGVMLIGTDIAALKQYGAQADREAEGDSEEEDGGTPQIGTKRKALSPNKDRGRPKKAQAGTPQTYQLRSRHREQGEGVIDPDPAAGIIKFKDKHLAEFVGRADLSDVGSGVSFTARKITDEPCPRRREWADYSEEQYERELVGRWH